MQATDASAVRKQVEHILASAVFAKSPRMSRFLKYVVEETRDGRSERIKEYAIALEVFDKNEKYDHKRIPLFVLRRASYVQSSRATYRGQSGNSSRIAHRAHRAQRMLRVMPG
jgi:hypothetical protein